MLNASDTIVAISSAVGMGARIIVRLSGGEAYILASRLCNGFQPSPASAQQVSLQFSGLRVPAWLYLFLAPHSYTGEHLVEFHLPGNPLLARMLVDALLRNGARAAEPGEFTARAYFNGRLDLTEAEGVAATIAAHSEEELLAARQLLAGELARRLRPMMERLAETLALIEVGIDFSDEDVSFLSEQQVVSRIEEIDAQLVELLAASARFERLAHEPIIVLAGRPNAGKSTLLNALAGQQRAIVSAIAGTTRDALSTEIYLPRGRVRIMDLAGVEDSSDAPEPVTSSTMKEVAGKMRRRAMEMVEQADIVVIVREAQDHRPPIGIGRQPDLLLRTKSDLIPPDQRIGEGIWISAATGDHLQTFRQKLDEIAFGRSAGASLALNSRHLAALDVCRAALAAAKSHCRDGPELLAMELREALDALGGILGNMSPDDLLGKIFSAFCIGK